MQSKLKQLLKTLTVLMHSNTANQETSISGQMIHFADSLAACQVESAPDVSGSL